MAESSSLTAREDIRKQKELDEARKAGKIPAQKDEEGRDINPHIPQYIAKAPWYLGQERPSLKHQRFKAEEHGDIFEWYKRGVKEERPMKFRKGACQNCGAVTHTSKACTERPRKVGAKYTGSNMCADEYITEPTKDLGFDGKRDRWAGYDASVYNKSVLRDYELADLERKRRKANELQEQLRITKSRRKAKKLRKKLRKIEAPGIDGENEENDTDNSNTDIDSTSEGDHNSDTDTDSDTDDEGVDDEDAKIRDFDTTNAPVGTKDDRTRTTTRNLRIREDTAKYLFNLDVKSAYYCPKTRSMRANPLAHLKEDEQRYKGDNAVMTSGMAGAVVQMEGFAWEAYKRGANVHFQGQPTQLEHMYQKHLDRKAALVVEKKEELLDKYGGREYIETPKDLLPAQTESYVEYNKDGTVKKTRDKLLAKSKYEEDVLLGNHSAVWGSYFDMKTQKWGFACCKQLSQHCDCTPVP